MMISMGQFGTVWSIGLKIFQGGDFEDEEEML